ncbi:hypothetical protein ATANTOWER_025353 [Ataeniobius toweri]|uniref:Uncharacterized protein n=1 Tax=Ataeniobius toweri TaxID=208326 RepID=A0ABU7B0Q6_9TELE|nr:hypothetical protein [Ataeniobius toweri]
MKWVQQQEETLRALYEEEVELSPSPLLLEEMEECFSETDWAALDFGPSRNRSSPAHTSSKPRRPRCKRSTPAAAALGCSSSGRARHTHSGFASAHAHSGLS